MELSYWQSRWQKGNTGFHLDEYYSGLIEHWKILGIEKDATVLVPLCGKSMDLLWLSNRVKTVAGVEVSQIAVNEFLKENKLTAVKKQFSTFTIAITGNIELWCGDFLKLPAEKFQTIDLIYDKGALTAMPPKMRKPYSEKLKSLGSHQTKIFIQHFEYKPDEMNGPPFSVPPKEILSLFADTHKVRSLQIKYLDIKNYKKFLNRGLKSHLIEYLSLLSRE